MFSGESELRKIVTWVGEWWWRSQPGKSEEENWGQTSLCCSGFAEDMAPPGMGIPYLVPKVETWVAGWHRRRKSTGMEAGGVPPGRTCLPESSHERKWQCAEFQGVNVRPWCWNNLVIRLWATSRPGFFTYKIRGWGGYRLISRHCLFPVLSILGLRFSLVCPRNLRLHLCDAPCFFLFLATCFHVYSRKVVRALKLLT